MNILANSQHAMAFILLGMLIQISLSLFPIIRREEIRELGTCFLFSLLFLIPWKHEYSYSCPMHVLMASGLFVFMWAIAFRDRLLPHLQEGAVLFWSCIFLYAIGHALGYQHKIFAYAFCITCIVLFVVLFPFLLSFVVKLIVYVWFLCMVVTVGILQFRFSHFGVFLGHDSERFTAFSAIVDGMAFVYLATYLVYLIILVPIPGKHQSLRNRLDEWRSDTTAMVERFSDVQLNPLVGFFFVGILGSVIYWNTVTTTLNPWVLINLLLVFTPPVIRALLSMINFLIMRKRQEF